MSTYHSLMGFTTLPRGHWTDHHNRKRFAEMLAEKLGYTDPTDWYGITQSKIEDFGGAGLIAKYYHRSPIMFVKDIISSDLKEWLFGSTPKGFWRDLTNVKVYMEWLYNVKKFETLDDWYNIRTDDFKENKGIGLLDVYNNTILSLLRAVYPDKTWYPWLFPVTTSGTWVDTTTHVAYIHWLAEKMGITTPDGWYLYDRNVLKDNKGEGLLSNYYGGSFTRLLKAVYPGYPFREYLFKKAPIGHWDNPDNRRLYLLDLYSHKEFTCTDDWYSITYEDFVEFHGAGFLDKYDGCYRDIITENIPHDWNSTQFIKSGYSNAQIKFIKELSDATGHEIQHALSEIGEFKPIPSRRFRVDGYIKDLNTIIDFHGCFFHGCPTCFPNRIECPRNDGTTYEDFYTRTIEREKLLRSEGYRVISVWECQVSGLSSIGDWFASQLETTSSE
jgi:hypothetical protein